MIPHHHPNCDDRRPMYLCTCHIPSERRRAWPKGVRVRRTMHHHFWHDWAHCCGENTAAWPRIILVFHVLLFLGANNEDLFKQDWELAWARLWRSFLLFYKFYVGYWPNKYAYNQGSYPAMLLAPCTLSAHSQALNLVQSRTTLERNMCLDAPFFGHELNLLCLL